MYFVHDQPQLREFFLLHPLNDHNSRLVYTVYCAFLHRPNMTQHLFRSLPYCESDAMSESHQDVSKINQVKFQHTLVHYPHQKQDSLHLSSSMYVSEEAINPFQKTPSKHLTPSQLLFVFHRLPS